MGMATTEDWFNRLDDTSDFTLLNEQIDLEQSGPILFHRGAAHVWDHSGRQANGLDDFVHDSGRSIFVIGVASDCHILEQGIQDQLTITSELSGGSDVSVISGDLYKESDFNVCNNTDQVPNGTLLPAP